MIYEALAVHIYIYTTTWHLYSSVLHMVVADFGAAETMGTRSTFRLLVYSKVNFTVCIY